MAAETIIESFCERCGTRYTFEPVRKRESKLVGLGKSLGILLDDPGTGLASRDPFHGTFHFCLECRQYTCPSCWNEDGGFCQGCVPLPDAPDTAALDAAEAAATLEAASWMDVAQAEHAALSDPDAWPDADLHRRRLEALASTARVTSHHPIADEHWEAPFNDDSWSLTFEPDAPVDITPEWQPDALAVGAAVDAGPADLADAPAEPHAHEVANALGASAIIADAEPALETVADPEAMAADGVDAEPGVETDQAADTDLAIDLAPEAELVADQGVVADLTVESTPEPMLEFTLESSPETAALVAASTDSDGEADWAHLLGHQPTWDGDDPITDDWSAMAPALGPDVAPVPIPLPDPISLTAPVAATPALGPATAGWQLTAPTPEADQRTAAWPPLGPVFRPTPAPAAVAPHPSVLSPHPSVLSSRPAAQGVMTRGQGHAGAPAPMPNGVRPCVSCELPLSASARFCRRCGRPQS